MTLIPLSPAHATFHDSPHDYGDMFVQGGSSGLVFREGQPAYLTAFVECCPGGSFIRGEGKTLAEADDACWAKVQAYLGCKEHIWNARNYRNGGGFCTNCGQFGSQVFTAEQLGLLCTVCSEPTFHTLGGRRNAEIRCEEHDPLWIYVIASLKALFHCDDEDGDGTAHAMYLRLNAVAREGAPGDPEALEWAMRNLDLGKA